MAHRKTTAKAIAVALMLLPALASADVFMKQKHHTDAMKMMGQTMPAKDEIHTIWLSGERARMDGPESSSIVRMDKNVMLLLNHKKKTYVEIPMGQEKNTMPGMSEQESATIQKLMKNMPKTVITITPTGERKKINNWNCTKYIQTLSGMNRSEIWATEDIKLNMDVFSKLLAAMTVKNPGMGGALDDAAAEMKKIRGVTVLTVSNMEMMGTKVNSSTELLEIKEGTAPAGIFEIPAGYKKSEF